MLEMPDVEEEQEQKKKKPKTEAQKQAQHRAWKKWYEGPRGIAWRTKRLKRPPEPAK